jgi:hypothetical protein
LTEIWQFNTGTEKGIPKMVIAKSRAKYNKTEQKIDRTEQKTNRMDQGFFHLGTVSEV